MYQRFRNILFVGLMLFCSACSTDFEVFAPEKEIYVVYSLLDPQADDQYVRVSRVFQFEGDNVEYASNNDISVSGLNLVLEGDDKIWESEEFRIQKNEGDFFRNQTIYRFKTTANRSLQPGKTYRLSIYTEDDSLLSTANTLIPSRPDIVGLQDVLKLPDGRYTYPSFAFEKDVDLSFTRGSGKAFELSVNLITEDSLTLSWRPLSAFSKSVRCGSDHPNSERVCYNIPAGHVLQAFRAQLNSLQSEVTYSDYPSVDEDPEELNRSAYIQVTAVDSFMARYLNVNDPGTFGVNLLMDKPEYTNLSGPHIGIFGSRNSDTEFIYLGSCSKYLSGLSSPAFPPFGCHWPE